MSIVDALASTIAFSQNNFLKKNLVCDECRFFDAKALIIINRFCHNFR